MEQPHGTLFLSMPSLLDPGLCPPGTHVIHAFTPDWIDNWKVLKQPSCVVQERAGVSTAAMSHCIEAGLDHAQPEASFATISPSIISPFLGWPAQGWRDATAAVHCQGLGAAEYEQKKEEAADSIVARLEPYFPGIKNAIVFRFEAFFLPLSSHLQCSTGHCDHCYR